MGKEKIKKTEVVKMGVALAAGLVGNTFYSAKVIEGGLAVLENIIRDCTQAVANQLTVNGVEIDGVPVVPPPAPAKDPA